jgi:hypothetical protein
MGAFRRRVVWKYCCDSDAAVRPLSPPNSHQDAADDEVPDMSGRDRGKRPMRRSCLGAAGARAFLGRGRPTRPPLLGLGVSWQPCSAARGFPAGAQIRTQRCGSAGRACRQPESKRDQDEEKAQLTPPSPARISRRLRRTARWARPPRVIAQAGVQRREAHLSTVEAGPQAPARVPCPHGDRWRPQGAGQPPSQGPQAPVGLIARAAALPMRRPRPCRPRLVT